ncbi:MAG: NAD(+)/NADH kinase [Tissierellia bacterium]|nr:NAD(+)/NADH kinase [Tissierellia bacterium]
MSQPRIINIISNRNYESRRVFQILKSKLEKSGFVTPDEFSHKAELSICIGGDGAFLRAVHNNKFPQVPFIGINTGHLGFYQEISPEDIDRFIDDYINKRFETFEMSLVEAKVFTDKKNYFLNAVNEIVVRGQKSKVIHLDVFVDGNHLEKFSGDGIIISTPHGSTGYNFSAGGAIIHPRLSAVQINPIAPMSSRAYRSLPNPIVVPGNWTIGVHPEQRYKNGTTIVLDGTEMFYKDIIKINLRISSKKISRISFSSHTYWENLKTKFL